MSSVLLVGKPNSGKTLLFNRLTGLAQKVANFPGVTVEIKTGQLDEINIVDFPGTYSLSPLTTDEKVAVDRFHAALSNSEVKTVTCILDATKLERSLVFALQAQRAAKSAGKNIVFALNMMDELERVKAKIDIDGLSQELGAPVIPVSAKTRTGLDILTTTLKESVKNEVAPITEKSDDLIERASELAKKFGINNAPFINEQNKLDRVLLSSLLGGPIFLFLMLILFQSIFTWASPFMDWTEEAIGWLGQISTASLSDGIIKDFLLDAIFGGLGSFLVFIPQIVVLTFIIGLLEDSGYLARAALICHKPLSLFGLSGRSFIPYLSGHACAIPAIMAARTIESPKKRLITILTIPFTVCSARLPVYALLTVVLIPDTTFMGGLIGYRGIAFFGLYFFGILAALVVSALLNKFLTKKETDAPFILELPPYRLPSLRPLLYKSFNAGKAFVINAGLVIFVCTVVIWVLGYFPQNDAGLAGSILGTMGRFIEPIFAPIGLDWKYGVAVLTSFAAREVFVGTLGTLFGIEGADDDIDGLAAQISNSGLTMASGFALLAFYAIALQCVATVGVIQKELGNAKKAWGVFAAYSIAAYIAACITYSILS